MNPEKNYPGKEYANWQAPSNDNKRDKWYEDWKNSSDYKESKEKVDRLLVAQEENPNPDDEDMAESRKRVQALLDNQEERPFRQRLAEDYNIILPDKIEGADEWRRTCLEYTEALVNKLETPKEEAWSIAKKQLESFGYPEQNDPRTLKQQFLEDYNIILPTTTKSDEWRDVYIKYTKVLITRGVPEKKAWNDSRRFIQSILPDEIEDIEKW